MRANGAESTRDAFFILAGWYRIGTKRVRRVGAAHWHYGRLAATVRQFVPLLRNLHNVQQAALLQANCLIEVKYMIRRNLDRSHNFHIK